MRARLWAQKFASSVGRVWDSAPPAPVADPAPRCPAGVPLVVPFIFLFFHLTHFSVSSACSTSVIFYFPFASFSIFTYVVLAPSMRCRVCAWSWCVLVRCHTLACGSSFHTCILSSRLFHPRCVWVSKWVRFLTCLVAYSYCTSNKRCSRLCLSRARTFQSRVGSLTYRSSSGGAAWLPHVVCCLGVRLCRYATDPFPEGIMPPLSA